MVNLENQSHALCLLVSVVIHVLIPAISIQVPALILAPSLLLNTCDPCTCFLFIQKSVCPESDSRVHRIRYAGDSPLSEISGGWWNLSLLDKVRFPKPPWISSNFTDYSRQWDKIATFRFWVMRIAIVAQTTGGGEGNRRCLYICFLNAYDWDKVGLQLFFHMLYAVDLDYKIGSNQPYDVRWMETHKSRPIYLKNVFGFGSIGMTPSLLISEEWDCVVLYRPIGKYLKQQLWKRGYFGMKEETIVSKRKQYDILISKKIKTKSNPHRKTRLRKCWYPIVIVSNLTMETLGLTMQCAIWRSSEEKLSTHTIRIRARSNIGKENTGFHKPVATKTYLRKASSNSLLFVYLSHYMAHIIAYVIMCFSKVLYTDFVI